MESESNFTQELWTKYSSSNHKQKPDPQFKSHDMLALKTINPFPAKESMLLSKTVGALSPVNHIGLYQGQQFLPKRIMQTG